MWYYMYPDSAGVDDLPYFLHSIGQHDLQPRILKPDGDEYDQFFYNTKGDGTLILQGNKYNLPAGCGFFIPAHMPHEYYPNGTTWDIRWMVPRGAGLPLLYEKLGIKAGVYHLWNLTGLEIQMNKMRDELLNDTTYGNYYASSHVQEYIMEFAKQAELLKKKPAPAPNEETGNKKRNTYQKHMNLVSDFVDHQYMNRIAEKDLCTLLDVTPQHLCRILRACTGMSPVEYINHIRIKKAKEYFGFTNVNACEIARRCGYENNNYFWRTFKKATGLSPGEYRKRYHAVEL